MSDGKIIIYNNQKCYIGFAKEPLMVNDNGIGFKGVKLQNENKTLIQCSECGKFMKGIYATHLKTHNLTMLQYKNKYGYNIQSSLLSDSTSLQKSNRMLGLSHSFSNNKTAQSVGTLSLIPYWKQKNARPISMEEKNLLGTCPEQVKERIRNFIKRFKRLPSPSMQGEDSRALVSLLKHRYGKTNIGLKELDLPTRHQKGNYVQYKFKDGEIINCGFKKDNYELLYEKIIKTSNLFKQK